MTETEDSIISRGQNVVIAEGGWGPVVPYPPIDHSGGERNHGYIDLRSDPELALQIPEVLDYPELGKLLKIINTDPSPLFSIGCECGSFPYKRPTAAGITAYLSSYIDVAFVQLEQNKIKENLLGLATKISEPFNRLTDPWTQLEIELQQARSLLGESGCWMLQTKVMGFGPDQDGARQTWARGIRCYMASIENFHSDET